MKNFYMVAKEQFVERRQRLRRHEAKSEKDDKRGPLV